MRIIKFNESINSQELLHQLFVEASEVFEEVKDLFVEIEDSKNFTYGYNYCAYYPQNELFITSGYLCDSYTQIEHYFNDKSKKDIIEGTANISFMIGISCSSDDLPEANVDTFDYSDDEIEGESSRFVAYTQTHLANFIRLTQTIKQVDLRIKKSEYDIKYQFDNYGATILIGRKNSNK